MLDIQSDTGCCYTRAYMAQPESYASDEHGLHVDKFPTSIWLSPEQFSPSDVATHVSTSHNTTEKKRIDLVRLTCSKCNRVCEHLTGTKKDIKAKKASRTINQPKPKDKLHTFLSKSSLMALSEYFATIANQT